MSTVIARSDRPAALALCVCLALGAAACATTAVETASGTWHEVRTPRFRAWTDSDPAEAAALLHDLERFHRVVLKITSATDQEGTLPLLIWIARDEATFRAWTGQDLTGVFIPTMLGNLAVVTSQAARAPKDGEVTARHILCHEYTHYLVAQSGARVPSWYNKSWKRRASPRSRRAGTASAADEVSRIRTLRAGTRCTTSTRAPSSARSSLAISS